jgi:hypothetical protein
MYDPTMGVWLQRDPVEEGRNQYQYVDSNPTKLVDPLGLAALSQEGFNELAGLLGQHPQPGGFQTNAQYDGKQATMWLQGILHVPQTGSFDAEGRLAAMRQVVTARLGSCPCVSDLSKKIQQLEQTLKALDPQKNADQIKKAQADLEAAKNQRSRTLSTLALISEVMFGEFGTMDRQITSANFGDYARVVGWTTKNRVGNKRFPKATDIDAAITTGGYQALNEKTPAFQIAAWAFGNALMNDVWSNAKATETKPLGLAYSMNEAIFIDRLKKLATAVDVACEVFSAAKPPEGYAGVVMYYTPAVITWPSSWKRSELVECTFKSIDPKLISAWGYK